VNLRNNNRTLTSLWLISESAPDSALLDGSMALIFSLAHYPRKSYSNATDAELIQNLVAAKLWAADERAQRATSLWLVYSQDMKAPAHQRLSHRAARAMVALLTEEAGLRLDAHAAAAKLLRKAMK